MCLCFPAWKLFGGLVMFAPIHLNVSRILRIPASELGGFLKRLDRLLQEEYRV